MPSDCAVKGVGLWPIACWDCGLDFPPSSAWMSVSCECCVLSGTGPYVKTDHSSRGVLPSVVCFLECDSATSNRDDALAH